MSTITTAVLVLGLVGGTFGERDDDTKARIKEVIKLTNDARTKEERPALKVSEALGTLAQAHADNMARQKTMAHELDGKGPGDRLDASGYKYRTWAENVGRGARSADEAFQTWMDSPPHKTNLLNEKVTEIGVGWAVDSDGMTYYCQVFADPLKNK